MIGDFRLFPEQASTVASRVDAVYLSLCAFGIATALLVAFLIVFFGIRYRRGANVNRTSGGGPGIVIEMMWSIPLFVISISIFVWAGQLYFDIREAPEATLDIFVLGKQWMWQIEQPDGRREINELHVPVGETVRLTMTSEDVIHSFYIPAFRVKMDVLPGAYSQAWFTPTKTGEYHLFCAEYCGVEHSLMGGRVVVMEQSEYQDWLGGMTGAALTPESRGRRLFQQFGCETCHVPDGVVDAPMLAGVYGAEVALESGEVVIADEEYLRESILRPNAKIVQGYEPVMPSFEGQIQETELRSLIEYIKSLADEEVETQEGAEEPEP
ncbi:MAG: cytochrome c oxidase subunit II [Phycisphaerales bacterium]